MSVTKVSLGRSRRWASVVCALTINLCAAAPPDDGLTVGAGAGYGQHSYASSGCGGPVYRNEVTGLRAHARAQVHSRESRLSASLEGTYSQGEVTDSELFDAPSGDASRDEQSGAVGQTRRAYSLALRGGAHSDRVGIELGPALVASETYVGSDKLFPMLSMNMWAGVPSLVYAWIDVMSGPSAPDWALLSGGIGHKGEGVRLSLGLASSEFSPQVTGRLDIKLPTAQPVWLGIVAHASSEATSGVVVMVEVPLKID